MIAEFGTGQVVWSLFWFSLFFIWIWMFIVVFGDIFRSPDLTGWDKALWTICIIVLPYIGFLVYLIARGRELPERRARAARGRAAAVPAYVYDLAPTTGGYAAD